MPHGWDAGPQAHSEAGAGQFATRGNTDVESSDPRLLRQTEVNIRIVRRHVAILGIKPTHLIAQPNDRPVALRVAGGTSQLDLDAIETGG